MSFQAKLESDYEESQNLLKVKEKKVDELTRELADIGRHGDGMSAETRSELEQEVTRLQQEVTEYQSKLDEKEDEIFSLNEKVEELVQLFIFYFFEKYLIKIMFHNVPRKFPTFSIHPHQSVT